MAKVGLTVRFKQSGGALVSVLLISVALASIAGLLLVNSKVHTKRVQIAKDYLAAERLLISDLNSYIYDVQTSPYIIMGDSALAPPYDSNLPKGNNLYGKSFLYENSVLTIQDMGGLVYLVPFNRNRIKTYLENKGWPKQEISVFLDVLADWKDGDSFEHINGAESNDYRVEGYPINKELQTKEDLALLANIDPKLLEELASDNKVLLYNSGRDTHDYAPEELLTTFLPHYDAERFILERNKFVHGEKVTAIDDYSSSNWVIKVSTSYGEAKSSRMLHVLRRFGDERPFVISQWHERAK